jgi:O-antigen ligase
MNALLSRVRVTAVLAGLMCSTPFLQARHTYPITSFYSEWLAFVLGLAAIASMALRPAAGALRIPRIAAFPLLLAVIVVVESLLLDLPYMEPVVVAAGYLVWAAGLAIAGTRLRDHLGAERAAVLIAWFIVVGAVLNALAALAQYCLMPGTLGPLVSNRLTAQVYGNLGQPNHLADQLTLGLASLLLLYALRRIRLDVATALCAIMLLALALSGSRSAWLYLISIAACAGVMHRVRKSAESRRTFFFALALLPAFGVANGIWALPGLATLPGATSVQRWALAWGAPSERLALWREAWAMFMARPLFGAGWGQFAWQHFSFFAPVETSMLDGLYTHSHNVVLQLLAETGITGTAVAVGGVGLWMVNLRRLLTTTAGWWIVALLAVLAIHSMLEYPLWNAYFLGVSALLLGMGDDRPVTLVHASAIRGSVIVVSVSLAVAAYMLFRDYARLEVAYAPRSQHADESAPHSLLLQPYFDVARAGRLALDANRLPDKLALTCRAIRFQPTSAVAYRRSLFLALSGDRVRAEAVLEQAINAYPNMLKAFVEDLDDRGIEGRGAPRWYGEALRRRAALPLGA